MQRSMYIGIVAGLGLVFYVATVTPAVAVELPEFSAETGFTGAAEVLTFVTGEDSVSCKSSEIKATSSSKKAGAFTLAAHSCAALGVKCNTEGDAAGTILASGEWEFAKSESGPMMLLSPKAFTITSSILQAAVRGDALIRVEGPLDSKAKSFEILGQQAEGNQEGVEYENTAGEKKTATLEASINKGAYKDAALEASSVTMTTEKEAEISKVPTFDVHPKKGDRFMRRNTSEDIVVHHGIPFFNATLKEILFLTASAAWGVNEIGR